MPPGGAETLVRKISQEGEYSWDRCLAASERKLLVIDCHQSWCGPCETLQPTFYRIYLETNDSDDRCMFLSADLEKFADQVQNTLPKDCSVDLSKHGCMPFIVLLKFIPHRAPRQSGNAVSTVQGCDVPAIVREVNKHMPPLPTGDSDSEAG